MKKSIFLGLVLMATGMMFVSCQSNGCKCTQTVGSTTTVGTISNEELKSDYKVEKCSELQSIIKSNYARANETADVTCKGI